MPRLLISLGANLGNTYETMLAASRLLVDAFGSEHTRLSRLYRTPPIGGPTGQSEFLNAVASIQTERSCWEVWDTIKGMERDLGRQRQHRWEARRIDIDILLHGDARVWTPHLKIPHPRMCMRSFVLGPAMDVAPDAIEPVTGWAIRRLVENLRDAAERSIQVVANTEETRHRIEAAVGPSSIDRSVPNVRFETCESPSQLSTLGETDPDPIALRIVCVRTPDPESVQWEDFALPWAIALGLTPSHAAPGLQGPRYLLPANDLEWTAHEIEASRQAMTCPIEPVERPFHLPQL